MLRSKVNIGLTVETLQLRRTYKKQVTKETQHKIDERFKHFPLGFNVFNIKNSQTAVLTFLRECCFCCTVISGQGGTVEVNKTLILSAAIRHPYDRHTAR